MWISGSPTKQISFGSCTLKNKNKTDADVHEAPLRIIHNNYSTNQYI